jgi:hypothetical protein
MKIIPPGLFERSDDLTRAGVFSWWGSRLLDFNLAVGVVGLVTWFLVLIAGSAAVKPGVDFEEPIAMIFGPIIYAALANLCYFLGPIFDLVFFTGKPRVGLFKLGLAFSVILTALPGLCAVTAWLISVYTRQKMD